MRAGGIGPGVGEGPEARFAVGDHGEGIEKIPRRSRQPVEPAHHQHIIGVDLLERLAQLGAVSLRAARCLAEYLFASALVSWRTWASTL
jgi:hypothetical protein